jgi:hypothetical protein
MLKLIANLLHLPPAGGSMMVSADMGTHLWRDRYGRHWAWQYEKWIPISEFRRWGPKPTLKKYSG